MVEGNGRLGPSKQIVKTKTAWAGGVGQMRQATFSVCDFNVHWRAARPRPHELQQKFGLT